MALAGDTVALSLEEESADICKVPLLTVFPWMVTVSTGRLATVTVIEVDLSPAVAVIFAVPSLRAVSSFPLTDMTDGSELVNVTF